MKKAFLFIVILIHIGLSAYPQLPQTGLVYMNFMNSLNFTTNDSLFHYDPAQPVSATNPSLNSITLPVGNVGLAVSPILGSGDTTQTFYTVVNGVYWYYDYNSSVWVNTGDSIIISGATNIGAGGGYIYSLRAFGNFPNVYRYDGTGNATYLTSVVAPLPYDLLVDCSGDFYIISLIGPMWSMTKYSSSGAILQGYTVSNPNNWAPSGGMANIGSDIYLDFSSQANFIQASLSGSTLTFNTTTANMPFMLASHSVGDMANVPGSLSATLPQVTIVVANSTLCPGDSATFTSNVVNGVLGAQYQWYVNGIPYPGATDSLFTYQPLNSDTVTLHYTSASTCGTFSAISAGTVMQVSMPIAAVDYGSGPFCNSIGFLIPSTVGIGGTYSAPNGLSFNTSTGVINTIASVPGTYIVTYTSALGSCLAIASDTITILASQHIDTAISAATSGCSICDGEIILNGLIPGQAETTSYLFNGIAQPAQTITAGPDSTIVLSNLCAGAYTGIQITSGTCPSLPVNAIVLNPVIHAGFTFNAYYGCENDTVIFNNISTTFSTPSYIWELGDQSQSTEEAPQHIYSAQGIYTVQLIVNDNGCTDTIRQTVELMHPVTSSFTVSEDTICIGVPVTFINQSVGLDPTFIWQFGDGFRDTSLNPIHTFNQAGTFPITLLEKDAIGCLDSTSYLAYVDSSCIHFENHVSLPNAFTPNGDGLNDVFRLVGIRSAALESFQVFNRWGQCVFYTRDINRGWDGTFHGEKADLGVYHYLIFLGNISADGKGETKMLNGDVVLMR